MSNNLTLRVDITSKIQQKYEDININKLYLETYLTNASSDVVFKWFENNKPFNDPLSQKLSSDFIKELLKRNEPLIDLSIAQYCPNEEILFELYNNKKYHKLKYIILRNY